MDGGSVKPEIYQDMSELLDKQVNAQEENFWGSRKLLEAHKKVCETDKQRKK